MVDTTTDKRYRLLGYVRVSTDFQAERGLGLQIQRQQLADWSVRTGHRLVGIVSDDGVSGTVPAMDRPGLGAALTAIRNKDFDGVVVPRLDRLARSLTVQEATLALVWRYGGRVYSVDTGEILRDDPAEPMRTALRQITGAISELERGTIRARLLSGRRAKRAAGGRAEGAPGFGYVALNKTLVPVPEQQHVVRRMQTMREAGATLNNIAATLNAEGVPACYGGSWYPSSVSNVLRRAAVQSTERRVTA